jgi:hypothetical protein
LFEDEVAHASPIGSPGGGVDADCAVGITGMIRGDVSLSIITDLASTATLDAIEQDRVCDERTECARRCAEAVETQSPQCSSIIRHGTTRSAVRGSKNPPQYNLKAVLRCDLCGFCHAPAPCSEEGLTYFPTVSPTTSVLLFAPALTRGQDRRACSVNSSKVMRTVLVGCSCGCSANWPDVQTVHSVEYTAAWCVTDAEGPHTKSTYSIQLRRMSSIVTTPCSTGACHNAVVARSDEIVRHAAIAS